jgi:hypothetical protein
MADLQSAPRALDRSGSLVVDIAEGERLVVNVPPDLEEGRKLSITMVHKSGRRARLRITTDDDVAIDRKTG